MILKRTIAKTHSACNSNLLLWSAALLCNNSCQDKSTLLTLLTEALWQAKTWPAVWVLMQLLKICILFQVTAVAACVQAGPICQKVHCVWQYVATLHCKNLLWKNNHPISHSCFASAMVEGIKGLSSGLNQLCSLKSLLPRHWSTSSDKLERQMCERLHPQCRSNWNAVSRFSSTHHGPNKFWAMPILSMAPNQVAW